VVAAAAIGIGLATGLIVGPWLDILTGDVWAIAGVIALASVATSTAIVGLRAVGRIPAMVAGVAVIFAIGNPFSGAATSPAMLDPTWAAIGQGIPPGAMATALRSVGYFDGAGVGGPLLVLAAWLVAGCLLALVGGAVQSRARARGSASAAEG
jgi:hypothetical protein